MKKAVLDKLDRVVIPKDFCKELNFSPGSPIVVTMEGGGVMIRSEQMVCRLCGATIDFDRELLLCDSCIAKVKKFPFEISNNQTKKQFA